MAPTKKVTKTPSRARAARTTTTRSRVVAESVDDMMSEAIPPAVPSMPSQANQTNKFLVILLVLLGAFCMYLFSEIKSIKKGAAAGGTQQQAAPDAPVEVKAKKPQGDDHRRGSANARFVMVEYSDLECPFCKQLHPTMQKAMQEYGDDVAWIYRHFPLSFHAKAQKTGEATECAAELGGQEGFWKMVDAIYEKMPAVEVSQLAQVAGELGMNAGAMQTCLDSNKYEKAVKDDQAEGVTAGVRATPTVVIFDTQTGKTKSLEGALPYESFKSELEALKAAK